MKKINLILFCIFVLCGCSRVRYHETDLKCLSWGNNDGFIEIDSLSADSDKAVVQVEGRKVIFEKFVPEDFAPLSGEFFYKNDTEGMIKYLFIVDIKEQNRVLYAIGPSVDARYVCKKFPIH